MNYGGRQEIIDAVNEIIVDMKAGKIESGEISENLINQYLYTSGISDPDLIIRTSGEMRLSNFLVWQSVYSELWVTETLWPDFHREEFLRAILDYQKRKRRFGAR